MIKAVNFFVAKNRKICGPTAKFAVVIIAMHTHTHTRLTAIFPGLPRSAGTRKAKPIWILLKQETVSGSGISWNICKSAPRPRQITMPAPHHTSFFTGRTPFLPPNQQRQSTEGINYSNAKEPNPPFKCRSKLKHNFRFNAIINDCMKLNRIIMTTESMYK